MTLYHTAQAIEASALGQTIRESTWLFPAIESTHLLALALLGGSILIMSLSIFGWGLNTPVAELYKSAHRYLNTAVVVLVITGIFLGISEPVKLYGREAFLVKMISLSVALLVTYFVFNPLIRRGQSGAAVRVVTALTLAAWLMVAMAGRWIGFS
jgi:hypothetical protein